MYAEMIYTMINILVTIIPDVQPNHLAKGIWASKNAITVVQGEMELPTEWKKPQGGWKSQRVASLPIKCFR